MLLPEHDRIINVRSGKHPCPFPSFLWLQIYQIRISSMDFRSQESKRREDKRDQQQQKAMPGATGADGNRFPVSLRMPSITSFYYSKGRMCTLLILSLEKMSQICES